MSNLDSLPPKVREKLLRLQNLQNTLQQLVTQKQQIEMEKMESEKALETLKTVEAESRIYKSVGAILVEKGKSDVTKELEERVDFLDMRLKVVVKQEEKAKEKLTGLQENLQKELGPQP